MDDGRKPFDPPAQGGPAQGKRWLDEKKNVDKVVWALCAACAGLILADLFYTKTDTHFAAERWFGFYGFYGFVACVLLVLAAKYLLRTVVKRDEDYYDR
jgi:hypothetical protein